MQIYREHFGELFRVKGTKKIYRLVEKVGDLVRMEDGKQNTILVPSTKIKLLVQKV